MTNIAEQTLANIVTNNHSTVPVFEKYHLDFCCKGKRTLADACKEKGLSVQTIAAELEQTASVKLGTTMPLAEMTAEQLISYLLIHHHFYVKQSMPIIMGHLEKVATKHGDRFPYMHEVLKLFTEIKEEMTSHMHKEEMILFPRIKEVFALKESHQKCNCAEGYISAPIAAMEHEHDHAGTIFYTIRELTNTYNPPADACTTMQVCFAELKEFEEDLHKHVHLENNLLFPLAEKMMIQQCQLN